MGTEFKNSDRHFRIIFEDSPAVMLLIDMETHRIIAANKASEKYYGWKTSQIETMLISDISTLSHDGIKAEMEKARKGERIYFRSKHRLANDEVRDVEVYSGKIQVEGKDYLHSIIHDAAEQVKTEKALLQSQSYNRMLIEQSPVGLALTTMEEKLVDINPAYAAIIERKKVEEALSYSHKLMQYIIEHNQSAVAVHDKDLNYIYVSQRYMDDYRVKDKDIIGKHHYEVFPDIPDKWREVHQKALRGIVSRADEDIFYREDGTFDWTRWECRPWHEADGSIGGIIIYTEVINEQKRKEKEIKELNLRLEILIESIQQLSSAKSLDSVQNIVARSARQGLKRIDR